MSFLLAGARLAAPVQMGPMGRSGGCLAFAGATAKRKVVRLLRSGSGARRGGGCGGPMRSPRPPLAGHSFCPGIEGIMRFGTIMRRLMFGHGGRVVREVL